MSDIRDEAAAAIGEGHGLWLDQAWALIEEIDRLRTELQQHQWRSIESAPRDGTELLLCWWCDLNGWQYEVAAYSNLDVARRGEGYCHGRATHFAYLPKPPEPDQ